MATKLGLAVLLLCHASSVIGIASFEKIVKCKNGGKPVTPAPPMPPLPESEFQMRVEGNIIDKNYGFTMTEYYSKPQNKGALRLLQAGEEFILIFDYNTQETIGINQNDDCRISGITDSTFRDLLGMKNLLSVQETFRFGPQFNQTYLGKKSVRGMPCDHWQSCLEWSDLQANFEANWYFSAPEWGSSTLNQVPVRLEVIGTGQQGGNHSFHHVYDFFDVRPYISDLQLNVFESPDLAYCTGRKNTKALPELTGRYSYREEIIIPEGFVYYSDMWYDFDRRIMRIDTRSTIGNQLLPTTEIHDFNTGIKYLLNKAYGNCTISALDNSTFDILQNSTDVSGFKVRMKNPMELFLIDQKDSFIYNGQKSYRGIIVDRWAGKTKAFRLPGLPPFNSTVELYFLARERNVEIPNVGSGSDNDDPVLVGMQVVSDDDAFSYQYHIYDWSTELPDRRIFDISLCYPDEGKQHFQIKFDVEWKPEYEGSRSQFMEEALTEVTLMANVDPLRVSNPQLDILDGTVYYTATLLDLPPSSAQFTFYPSRVKLQADDEQVLNIDNADQCADVCLAFNKFTCLSFDYCPDIKGCLLSKTHKSRGEKFNSDDYYCVHFSRNIDAVSQTRDNLLKAFKNLKNSVYAGVMQIFIVNMEDQDQTIKFTAKAVRDDIQRFENNNKFTSASWLRQFTKTKFTKLTLSPAMTVKQVSVDECANQCLIGLDIECGSFDFCYNTGDCNVYKERPLNPTNTTISHSADNCETFSRNFISRFKGWEGQTLLPRGEAISEQVASAEECARYCTVNSDCKSFDYCRITKTCVLGKQHRLEIPAKNIRQQPQCSHYSRKYIDDFQYESTVEISLLGKDEMSMVPLDECAMACVKGLGNKCQYFAYCDNTTQVGCVMESPGGGFVQSTLQQSQICRKFKRVFTDSGSIIPVNRPQVITSTTSTGYTSGQMAAVAMVLLVVGIVFGLAFFCGILRYRANKALPDGVQVSYNR